MTALGDGSDGTEHLAGISMAELQNHRFTDPEGGLSLPYRLFVPGGGSAQRSCGLLLFLHGTGECGDDNTAQLKNDALGFTRPEVQEGYPTIVVYPQCPLGMQWVDAPSIDGTYCLTQTPESKALAASVKLLTALQAQHRVDPRRLLVTGLSMGGYGAWDVVARYPGMFAGVLAVCGGGDPAQAPLMRALGWWSFHGDRDQSVPVSGARRMIEALRQAGGKPRYTEVAGSGHDVWTVAYRDVEVMRWLLAQRQYD
jgi:predicted peptidase